MRLSTVTRIQIVVVLESGPVYLSVYEVQADSQVGWLELLELEQLLELVLEPNGE